MARRYVLEGSRYGKVVSKYLMQCSEQAWSSDDVHFAPYMHEAGPVKVCTVSVMEPSQTCTVAAHVAEMKSFCTVAIETGPLFMLLPLTFWILAAVTNFILQGFYKIYTRLPILSFKDFTKYIPNARVANACVPSTVARDWIFLSWHCQVFDFWMHLINVASYQAWVPCEDHATSGQHLAFCSWEFT
jgi:hypothetical protein